MRDIFIEKARDVLRCGIDIVLLQNVGREVGIGFSRDFDAVQIIARAVTLSDYGLERFNAGAAGADEGAVDIEKEKALVFRACHVEPRRGGETSLIVSRVFKDNLTKSA